MFLDFTKLYPFYLHLISIILQMIIRFASISNLTKKVDYISFYVLHTFYVIILCDYYLLISSVHIEHPQNRLISNTPARLVR